MWVLFLVVVAMSYMLYKYVISHMEKCREINKIPGPPTKPIIGNIFDLGNNTTDILKNVGALFKKYGPTIRLWFGPFSFKIFTVNPNVYEQILASSEHLNKSSRYIEMADAFGEGLFICDEEKWKKNRKIEAPAFHFNCLDNFAETFNSVGKRLVQKLDSCSGEEVQRTIQLYTLDSVCESLFGVMGNALDGGSGLDYVQAVETYLDIRIVRFFSAFYRFDFFFKFSSLRKPYSESVDTIHNFGIKIIENRMKIRQVRDEKKLYLDILLDNNSLKTEEFKDAVHSMIIAAYDTTSTTVCFGLYALSKNKHVQNKVFEEIESIVAKGNDLILTRDLDNMDYLDRVFKETLRMYYPVPMIERRLGKDIILDDAKIPKDTEIMFYGFWLHRNVDRFPNPDVFDPDRFLPENMEDKHRYSFVPFGAGPRNCLGYKHATINFKVTFVNILRNFEILPVDDHDPVLANDGGLKSTNGLPFTLRRR